MAMLSKRKLDLSVPSGTGGRGFRWRDYRTSENVEDVRMPSRIGQDDDLLKENATRKVDPAVAVATTHEKRK